MHSVTEGHVVKRYDSELRDLLNRMLAMGSLVTEQVRHALAAVSDRDFDETDEIVKRDEEVDLQEVKLDDEIAHLLARRSPVGSDLRLVLAISKTVTDLERMGDEAVRIACMVRHIRKYDAIESSNMMLRDVAIMGKLVLELMEQTLDSFARLDAGIAEQIAAGRNELEMEFQSDVRRLITFVLEDAHNVGLAISIVAVIRDLVRLGDHARNLAEYVIYLAHGEDVRHREHDDRDDKDDLSGAL